MEGGGGIGFAGVSLTEVEAEEVLATGALVGVEEVVVVATGFEGNGAVVDVARAGIVLERIIAVEARTEVAIPVVAALIAVIVVVVVLVAVVEAGAVVGVVVDVVVVAEDEGGD